jgi:hypothetical protein
VNLEADAEAYYSDKSDQASNFDDCHFRFGEELTESLHGAPTFYQDRTGLTNFRSRTRNGKRVAKLLGSKRYDGELDIRLH